MVGLLFLNIWVSIQRLYDLFWVILLDYSRSLRFLLADLGLALAYITKSPYAISKAYWNSYTYGETPIRVLRKIAKYIGPDDVVYELGSGTGRACLWLHHRIGCRTVGIECIPVFVRRAQLFARGPEFVCDDFFTSDLSDASVVYLYGSMMTEDEVNRISTRIPSGARVITVSFPLPGFQLIHRFPVRFPWGRTHIYISRR